MQTQYKLLYRYVNPATNTAITNEADYEKTEEFFHTKHKSNVTQEYLDYLQENGYDLLYKHEEIADEDYLTILHNEGDKERESIITENMANENKSNNLYVYNGTKKYFHKNFIPDQLGYLVKDWKRVPKNQIPSGPDDYSKHFVIVGGNKLGVDGAYLICKPQYIKNYMKNKTLDNQRCFLNISTGDVQNKGYLKNNTYYQQNIYINYSEFKKLLDETTFFAWYDSKDESITASYGELPPSCSGHTEILNYDIDGKDYLVTSRLYLSSYNPYGQGKPKLISSNKYYYIFFNNENEDKQHVPEIQVDKKYNPTGDIYLYYDYEFWEIPKLIEDGYIDYGLNITIDEKNLIRDVIPAHYEQTGDNPYIIKDTYKKIDLSPWMLHSTHKSLEGGIDSARKLVSMIGIDNVKLIKYVPIDQFIKIK